MVEVAVGRGGIEQVLVGELDPEAATWAVASMMPR